MVLVVGIISYLDSNSTSISNSFRCISMEVAGIDLLKFGNEYQITGVIFNKGGHDVTLMLPNDLREVSIVPYEPSLEEWQKLIQQTDLLEVEVGGPLDKVKKALARKTARQIEQTISWTVYRRDNYSCRYCGKDDVPLTVDHLVLWEKGGPSIVNNLVSACKKCNRTRGNMEYADWIKSEYYLGVSATLPQSIKIDNQNILDTLDDIPRVRVFRKR